MTVASLMDQLSIFSTIFLGIFIEAAPFLMLGLCLLGWWRSFLIGMTSAAGCLVTRCMPLTPACLPINPRL